MDHVASGCAPLSTSSDNSEVSDRQPAYDTAFSDLHQIPQKRFRWSTERSLEFLSVVEPDLILRRPLKLKEASKILNKRHQCADFTVQRLARKRKQIMSLVPCLEFIRANLGELKLNPTYGIDNIESTDLFQTMESQFSQDKTMRLKLRKGDLRDVQKMWEILQASKSSPGTEHKYFISDRRASATSPTRRDDHTSTSTSHNNSHNNSHNSLHDATANSADNNCNGIYENTSTVLNSTLITSPEIPEEPEAVGTTPTPRKRVREEVALETSSKKICVPTPECLLSELKAPDIGLTPVGLISAEALSIHIQRESVTIFARLDDLVERGLLEEEQLEQFVSLGPQKTFKLISHLMAMKNEKRLVKFAKDALNDKWNIL